jgi:hypothetical protein
VRLQSECSESDCIVIAERSENEAKRLNRDWKATAKRLESSSKAIALQLKNVCKAIAGIVAWFLSDYKEIEEQKRSYCRAIAKSSEAIAK